MTPAEHTLARRAMNEWLREQGITQRSPVLIAAVIALFISLKSEDQP